MTLIHNKLYAAKKDTGDWYPQNIDTRWNILAAYNFRDYYFQINGIIYEGPTEAFAEAMEKLVIWKKLKNET